MQLDTYAVEEDVIERAYYTFLKYLDQVRGRLTKPRLNVARWIMSQRQSFVEQDIIAEVKRQGLPIGPRSIAKTIDLMENCGLLVSVKTGENIRYVSLASRKAGTLCLICVDCANVHDCLLPNSSLKTREINEKANHTPAFEVHAAKGYCRSCKEMKLQQQKSA